MIPIGLCLLFLTGVGPLFAWRRTSVESLRRNFMVPGLLACLLAIGLFAAGIRNYWALISFGFCLFVASTIISEFFKGARQIGAEEQPELRPCGSRIDAPQHAPLRRLSGPHGHRADVHWLDRHRF